MRIDNEEEVKSRLIRGIDATVSIVISSKADAMRGLTLRQVFLYIEESSSLLLPYADNTPVKGLITNAKIAVKKYIKALDKGYELTDEDSRSISTYYCLNRYFLEG